jgi:hypothetical protein
MGLGFDGMNKVRELDRFLYEEDGDIVPDDIPIAFLSVKLGGETANISNGVLRRHRVSVGGDRRCRTYCTTARALDRAKTYEHRGLT